MKYSKTSPIYFDHNASTPLEKSVINVMKSVLEKSFGNPSSSHIYGLRGKQYIEEARRHIAEMINAEPDEIIFTSGGSESNNMAIKGAVSKFENCHIITSQVEHPSVMNVCDNFAANKVRVSKISVDGFCEIDIEELVENIFEDTVLISVMLANNETGSIQPLQKISETVRNKNILVHTDAAQAAGKINIDVKELGVDLMTIAAHKMYGPKGIGALYIRNGVKINPLIIGANHENGLRAGTENVLEIAGLGEAAKVFAEESVEIVQYQREMRDYFVAQLRQKIPGIKINGNLETNLPNTANVYFPGKNANDILKAIPEIAASAGAACHSDSIIPSVVLKAMGCDDDRALGSIRFSFGRYNTKDEIDYAVKKVAEVFHESDSIKTGIDFRNQKLNLDNAMGCSCKISAKKLNNVLSNLAFTSESVNNCDDAGIYELDDENVLLSSVDFFAPIVDSPFDFGRIAAANALSDIYAMGGKPLYANNLVSFPLSEKTEALLVEILKGAQSITEAAGVGILGGHSIKDKDIKYGMSVTGIVKKDKLLKNSGAKIGDKLILTKPIGTGILSQAMKKGLLNDQEKNTVIRSMVTLNNKAAEILVQFDVSACTDVTGFGLLGHLSEMMKSSQTSADLYHSDIPLLPKSVEIARLGIFAEGYIGNLEYFEQFCMWEDSISKIYKSLFHDPQTSGGLLFAIDFKEADKIVELLQNNGIATGTIIGRVVEKKEKLIYIN